jgi:hypothetical protein
MNLFFPVEMSLNPSAQGRSLYDVLEGSVTSYFSRLAGVLQRNESVNGLYNTTVTGSYGANTPFKVPGFGRVCISSNGATVVDMANTFITMKLNYTLRFEQTIEACPTKENPITEDTDVKCRTLFVGFKNSLEALERYVIYVDSTKIYDQTWVGEESFIFNAGMSESVRQRNPWSYTCWEKVKKMDNSVCGVYIHLDNPLPIAAGTTFDIEIPVKINLHQILLLASVRYLPSFCGRWEIELYPSWKNLVIATVPPKTVVKRNYVRNVDGPITMSITAMPEVSQITAGFTQIGKPFTTISHLRTKKKIPIPAEEDADVDLPIPICADFEAMEQIISGVDGKCVECLCSVTTFHLRYEVYEQLRQMYTQNMLIIPSNILQYARFSGQPGNVDDGAPFHASLSQSLENCDSIFILVPFEHGQHTCFYQPYLRQVRMSLGEFGIHPNQSVRTWDDNRFYGMLIDALNLEASEITGMNDDVLRTFIDRRQCFRVTSGKDSTGATVNYWQAVEQGEEYGDKSNFFIGISLSQIGFQSGTVTSPNSAVPFMFDAQLDRPKGATTGEAGIHDTHPFDSSIVCMFLLDCAIMIQVVPDSDVPVVKLSTKSIV